MDKIRQKALMYVFGKHLPHIVSVTEDHHNYRIRYEKDALTGKYEEWLYPKRYDKIDEEINDALAQLRWIAAGNEFPT